MSRMMPSGRTPSEELKHKVRGWLDFLSNLNALFPRSIVVIILAGCSAALLWTYHVYEVSKNPRLMTGKELVLGTESFNAIRTADMVADDFSRGGVRTRASSDAALALARFQGAARSPEATRCSVIMAYYFDEVHRVSQADIDLAHARYDANKKDFVTATSPGVPYDDLALIETAIPYIEAQQERADAERILRTCRNEAMSYIYPNHQPPVDACVFAHDSPKVERGK